MPRKNFSRVEQKARIADAMLNAIAHGENNEFTMYRIAKILDMKPDQRITNLMLEMVDAGDLTVAVKTHRQNHWKRVFSLVDTDMQFIPVRTVKINVRGEQKGQLSLW